MKDRQKSWRDYLPTFTQAISIALLLGALLSNLPFFEMAVFVLLVDIVCKADEIARDLPKC